MKRLIGHINLVGVLILGFVIVAGINTWQRLDWSVVPATVRNLTLDPQTVRLVDGTTGTLLGTYEVPALKRSVLPEHRLAIWYRDLTVEEQAAGRSRVIVVELFAEGRCELVARMGVDHRDPRIDVMDDGLGTVFDERSPEVARASVVPDPCGGRPAIPTADIANQTVDRIVLGNGLSVAPCSVRTFGNADVTSQAGLGEVGIHVRVPSVDAQDERWPLERRVIAIAPEGVTDEPYRAFGRWDPKNCSGHVPADVVAP
jgi:hypothetical protein